MKKYSLLFPIFLYAFSYSRPEQLSTSPAIEWQQCLGGSRGDLAYCIKQTSNGGYIIAGYTYSIDGDVTSNDGLGDFWIVKHNKSGVTAWQRTLGGTSDVELFLDHGVVKINIGKIDCII